MQESCGCPPIPHLDSTRFAYVVQQSCGSCNRHVLLAWWQQSSDRLHTSLQQGCNTLVVLGAWSIWKTRNDVVFNGATPRIDRALLLVGDETDLWMLASAKDLSAMVATRLPN
jgi:hypothetical protein